jgi:hypothetical protein
MGVSREILRPVSGSNEWVRNPDWLPLPIIPDDESRIHILYLIFENEDSNNYFSWNLHSNQNYIDVGDGTPEILSNGTNQTHYYDYSTLSSPISVYYDGRNYKQVVIQIRQINSASNLAQVQIGRNIGVNDGGNWNAGDIQINWLANISTFSFIERRIGYLERFVIQNKSTFQHSSRGTWFRYIGERLGFIDLDFENNPFLVSVSNTFNSASTRALLDFGNIGSDTSNINDIRTTFSTNSSVLKVGNINCPNVITLGSQMFLTCISVEEVGDVNLPNCTNTNGFFNASFNLRKVGLINIPSSNNINNFFTNCFQLKEAIFTDLSGLVSNNNTNMFSGCVNLERIVVPNLTRGFSIANANMSASALLEMANSLGTAAGSQTITTTGNPGDADPAYQSVITGKGFILVI